jgi:hypothetical protein
MRDISIRDAVCNTNPLFRFSDSELTKIVPRTRRSSFVQLRRNLERTLLPFSHHSDKTQSTALTATDFE